MLSQKKFEKAFSSLEPDFRDKKYLLAVSGGADSMVLAYLFKVSGLKFDVALINYRLRGEDSDLDEKLVKNFCENHQIKLHLYQVSENDQKPEGSIQLWARNLRYDYFFKVLEEKNLDFIVTAHHLNDDLETFLINLSRGSGIKGLSGIPANENQILRPFLSFSKEEIYDFAKENNIEFREDLSNQKNDYLRNKIRNEIVPELKQINDNFLENFGKSLNYLYQTKIFVEEKISEIETKIIRVNDDNLVINKILFDKESDFVKTEILRKLGFIGIEIEKIINAENGKFFRSKTHEISIGRNEILCQKRTEK